MAPKTIIVTGASRGIGLAIAQYLLDQSHNVVVLARSKRPLDELASKYPGQVKVLAGDMSDFTLSQKAVDLTMSAFGSLDGLIINHGILAPVSKVGDSEAEAWRKSFDVNFFSAIAFCKAVLPTLRKSNGRIIFTSSGAAVSASSGWGAYGASKAAMNHLASTLSVEEPDVTTVSVRPGVVDTEMQREIRTTYASSMVEKDVTRFYSLHQEGRLLKPEQPGNVMARLVLNAPKELSGKFLNWDAKELADFQDGVSND